MWLSRHTFIVLVLLLAGCGYQLQSYERLPPEMQLTFIQASDHYSIFYRQLRKALDDAGITLTNNPAGATAVLVISGDDTGQRLVTVSAQNQPLEFEVYYNVSYRVRSGDSDLLPLQTISVLRDYTYDRTIVLGKRNEEEVLREALVRDLVRQVLRSLNTIGNGAA
jgi:LPS-assembly lipoprotein